MKLSSLKKKYLSISKPRQVFGLQIPKRCCRMVRPFAGEIDGHQVKLLNAKQLAGGEVLDLTEDIPANYDFFSEGPGYDALD